MLKRLENDNPNYLLIGDLNCRIRPYCKTYNANGKKLELFLLTSKGAILNKGNKPTSFWNSEGKESNAVLDLFIGTNLFNINVGKYTILNNSIVSPYEKNHYHVPVVMTFNLGRKRKIIQKSKNNSYV